MVSDRDIYQVEVAKLRAEIEELKAKNWLLESELNEAKSDFYDGAGELRKVYKLTPAESQFLGVLLDGKIRSPYEIIDKIYGEGRDFHHKTASVFLCRIRKNNLELKIKSARHAIWLEPDMIQTIRAAIGAT